MPTLTRHSIKEDFAAWAEQTADLLEERRFAEVDLADLVEEVRDLGRSDIRSVNSQIDRLFVHLMKWAYQPAMRCPSWEVSILNARLKLEQLLEESPSIKSRLKREAINRNWRRARKRAANESRLPPNTFPELCSWDFDSQVLNLDWLP